MVELRGDPVPYFVSGPYYLFSEPKHCGAPPDPPTSVEKCVPVFESWMDPFRSLVRPTHLKKEKIDKGFEVRKKCRSAQ